MRTFLLLYNSFIQDWFTPLLLKLPPLLCSPTKNPEILFAPPFKKKNTMQGTVFETTNVNISNLPEVDR